MSATPALDIRAFVDDERWPAYRDALSMRRDELDQRLVKGHLDHPTMCRLAGSIEALDFALGRPDELKRLDPAPSTP